jgi:SAM-dependent methyltransferase
VASTFAATNAEVYDRLMGRFSRRLAAPFISFAAIEDADSILDVGCGTGSLTFALAAAAPKAAITGIDVSQAFVDYARAAAKHPRLAFEQGDATALSFADQSFGAALSLLVLNFVPDWEKAAREMQRVSRPGAVVAAAVWDMRGGLPHLRVFLDTAAALDPGAGAALRAKMLSMPLTGAGELAALWVALGLREVEEAALTIRMDYHAFADYWEPWLGGQGMIGPYVASLSEEGRGAIERHVREAYLAGGDDGPRSFTATAWAVRGIR